MKHDEIIDHLKNNAEYLQELEPNLVKYEPCKTSGLQLVHIFETKKIKTDIDCFNEDDNAIVIIEVKSESEIADYNTFGQILYYMTNAEGLECANGKKVKTIRGIILAYKIHESLKTLIKEYGNKLPKISLKTYEWIDGKLDIKDAR